MESTVSALAERACSECGGVFVPVRENHAYCATRCKRRSESRRVAARRVSEYPKTRDCARCGASFEALNGRHLLCADAACKQAHKTETARGYNRDRERAFFEEHGVWRATKHRRDNPGVAHENLERKRERDRLRNAELPNRKRYPETYRLKDARRRQRKFGLTPVGEPLDREVVFARDGWVCQLCFEPVDASLAYTHMESKSLDHRVPISKGGAHTYENTQLAHLRCNIAKGDRLLEGA